MKTMKRFLAAAIAVTSVMAIAPMSAFAENETGGSTNVTFDAPRNSPEFTITIPASVDLNSTTRTATITAENVYLDTTKHKQINVTLDSAEYVNTGDSTFIAKTADGNSSVTYTIGKDTATTGVKVGDTVAEFTADDSVTLNFSEPTGATYAGTHTETLTFGIAVEDAAPATVLSGMFENGAVTTVYFKWRGLDKGDYVSGTYDGTAFTAGKGGMYFGSDKKAQIAATKNGNKLVLQAGYYGFDGEGMTFTLDADTDTYTVAYGRTAQDFNNDRPGSFDLISIKLNGTDITSQLTRN